MDKINRKLFTSFLILGIICFISFIYLFIKYEVAKIFSADLNHTVKIYSIRVTENKSVDSAALKKFNEGSDTTFSEHFVEHYYYSVINKVDNTSYAKSESFDDRLPLEYYIVRFDENSLIPQQTFNDKYDIVVVQDKRNVATFPIKSFNQLLDLKNKTDDLTEEKQVEIISTTKKIKILVKFLID